MFFFALDFFLHFSSLLRPEFSSSSSLTREMVLTEEWGGGSQEQALESGESGKTLGTSLHIVRELEYLAVQQRQ
jgi:hypothetical protein